MPHHISLGRLGEKIAQQYVSRYCTIRHCNWKYGRKEIDIIAESKGTIYFIEVKARSSNNFGWPEEAVNFRKQEAILCAAENYLLEFGLNPVAIRFDIISITFMKECHELKHFKDVF